MCKACHFASMSFRKSPNIVSQLMICDSYSPNTAPNVSRVSHTRTCDIVCRCVPGDPGRKNWPPEPFLCQPWLLTGKIPDHQNFFSKYPGMGFPGPWGKNPFSRQIIGAALSCHHFTQRTKPPIIGEDNVLHVTDSPKKRSPQLNLTPPHWTLFLETDRPATRLLDRTPAHSFFFLGF